MTYDIYYEPPEEEDFEISWDQIILHWFWQLENMDSDEARQEIEEL
ncbi:MAG TPA: hypothetical protein VFS97_15440 [Nitrososphaeraceae archaeon]|nr:hypothetical protein [Nitrososphaeraceae archaeon]